MNENDVKSKLIDNIEKLVLINTWENNIWKVKSYKTCLEKLQECDNELKSEDNIDKLDLSKNMKSKLKSMINTSDEWSEISSKSDILNNCLIVKELSEIHNIGTAKAKQLVNDHGIKSIQQLKSSVHLLNEKQRLGLRYYDDIKVRIPCEEITNHEQFILKTLSKISSTLQVNITGSYRRCCESSGDIDVLISDKTKDVNILYTIVSKLKDIGYIPNDGIFALGKSKFMGMCKLIDDKYTIWRRIDILVIPNEEYIFALLYFTGDHKYNVLMRNHALKNGYTLNEKGLYDRNSMNRIPNLVTEKCIFDYLKIVYKEPKERTESNFKCIDN